MKRFFSHFAGTMLLLSVASSCNSPTLVSPDGSLSVNVTEEGFTASRGAATQKVSFIGGPLKASSPKKTVKESYTLVAGSRKECSYVATTKTFTFGEFRMEMRLFDYAVAYRFIGKEPQTSYFVPEGRKRWMGNYGFAGYEALFPESTSSSSGKWIYPALLEYGDGMFGLIGEAGIDRGHSCSMLEATEQQGVYKVAVTDKNPTYEVSPWRFVMMGSLAEIVESSLVTDLSAPCKIEDTSWIQPGVSSWIYWAYNHGSKDYGIVTSYIDLAARMGWPYCLVDWEWPDMEGGKSIEDVLRYAVDKGVKINLWYNSGTSWVGEGAAKPEDRLRTAEAREKEFTWLESLGVSGVKVDFFAEDDTRMVNYYIDILEDAAKHHLLVDFHGCTIPRGWQRTYPNLMSMEAVYGAEWYNNVPSFTDRAASHNATLPFTRNVMGPMDYTPCAFTHSQHPHITSDAHELALPILFQSSLQHMADRPESFLSQRAPVRQLLSDLPATWDETRLLGGYPAEYVVMARRSADRWYICGINGTDQEKTLSVDLSKIGHAGEEVTLFTDSPDGCAIGTGKVSSSVLDLKCLPRGGFVAYFDK